MHSIEKMVSCNVLEDKPCVKPEEAAKAPLFPVKTYTELVSLAAKVSYGNRAMFPLFRGQRMEYLTCSSAPRTKLQPSLDRPCCGDVRLKKEVRQQRIDALDEATEELKMTAKKHFNIKNFDIEHFHEISWGILQHYGILPTPLLDLTQSLHIACSFAALDNDTDTGVVYMLGIEELSPAISFSYFNRSLVMRLSSVMPDRALRPLYQEGYLIANFPRSYWGDDKQDFSNRLLAKFSFNPHNKTFWDKGFGKIPKDVLLPKNDSMIALLEPLSKKYAHLRDK
jgi:hypothetical protein